MGPITISNCRLKGKENNSIITLQGTYVAERITEKKSSAALMV